MPRTIPQQEIDRIQELAKLRPKLTAYAIAKIIQQENGTLTYPSPMTVKSYMKK